MTHNICKPYQTSLLLSHLNSNLPTHTKDQHASVLTPLIHTHTVHMRPFTPWPLLLSHLSFNLPTHYQHLHASVLTHLSSTPTFCISSVIPWAQSHPGLCNDMQPIPHGHGGAEVVGHLGARHHLPELEAGQQACQHKHALQLSKALAQAQPGACIPHRRTAGRQASAMRSGDQYRVWVFRVALGTNWQPAW